MLFPVGRNSLSTEAVDEILRTCSVALSPAVAGSVKSATRFGAVVGLPITTTCDSSTTFRFGTLTYGVLTSLEDPSARWVMRKAPSGPLDSHESAESAQ